MTVIAKEWNGSKVAYNFDPEHAVAVVRYYKTLVANGTLAGFEVVNV